MNLVKTSPTSCHYHNGFSTYFSYSTRQIHLGEPFPLPPCRHETILTVYSYILQTNFHLQTRDELHGYIFVHIDNPMKNNLYGLWCCWCCLWLWLICNDFLFYSESTENSLQSQYLHILLSVCSGHLEEWYLLREEKRRYIVNCLYWSDSVSASDHYTRTPLVSNNKEHCNAPTEKNWDCFDCKQYIYLVVERIRGWHKNW